MRKSRTVTVTSTAPGPVKHRHPSRPGVRLEVRPGANVLSARLWRAYATQPSVRRRLESGAYRVEAVPAKPAPRRLSTAVLPTPDAAR